MPGELQVLNSASASQPETVRTETHRPRAQLPRMGAPGNAPPAEFSPSLEAKFGLEIEIPSVDVSTGAGGPALHRGIVLLERPHWKLECDDNGGGKHDLEFVTNPLGSEVEVRAAIREITALTAAIRTRALAGDMTVRLGAVVNDARVDAVLRLNDPHMPGRLQATYGVALDHFGVLIDELLTQNQSEGIHRNTQAVADFYAARTGEPLPSRARSFIQLVYMYLSRAQSKLPADGTVHIFFRAMARSDFCAAFSKLLAPGEQEAVRRLLVAPEGLRKGVPMMMEALNMYDPAQRVFARPYLLADRNPNHRQAGPTIKDWLASIVEGRQEGSLRKDLLSPPVGYRLHGGDASADYGMGALGVDERNGLMLFEIRGAPYRSRYVTMNGQLARAADNELARAGRHNPALKTSVRGVVASAKYDALREADDAYAGLRDAVGTLEARAAELNTGGWKYARIFFESQLNRLTKARVAIAARSQSSWAPQLVLAMDELHKSAHDVLRAGNEGKLQDPTATLEPIKAALAQYEDALWNAGARRKSGEHSPPRSLRSPSLPPAQRQRLLSGEGLPPRSAGPSDPGSARTETHRPRAQPPRPGSPASASSAEFSPSLEAKFGLEIEMSSVDVSTDPGGPALHRGIVLLERPHWKLECDHIGGGKYDLEFVTDPLASADDVGAAIREITTLTAAIRTRALAGDMTVRLGDVVSDARIDAVLRLNDPHMSGCLQATYGVGLDHLGVLIDELLPQKQAEGIHVNTRTVADFYAARTGEPLPSRARAFVQLICMYLARTQSNLLADGTVHILFRAMARSDFCAAFSKLLAPGEQAALRALLVAPEGLPKAVPMMMEALRMRDPERRVFAKPYNRADRNPDHRQAGPTIKDWLASIVEGRQEGPFRKDLLSPPVGYPLHSGNLSTDYGMGAMGVDERNGLMLFEIRGAPYRSRRVTMNGQLARVVDNELARAGRYNPALKTSVRGAVASAKYRALHGAEQALVDLRNTVETIEARPQALTASGWKYLGKDIESQLTGLTKARMAIAARTRSAWAPQLVLAMDELHNSAHEVLQSGNNGKLQDLAAKLEPLKVALAQYEDLLWKAGARRK